MSRRGWGAVAPKEPNTPLRKPVKIAAVFHTSFVEDRCKATEDCCGIVKEMQTSAMKGIVVFYI
jgi:hypothetical protein